MEYKKPVGGNTKKEISFDEQPMAALTMTRKLMRGSSYTCMDLMQGEEEDRE
jgi:hypothetical protein